MAQPFVTGAATLFVGRAGDTLGTAETATARQIQPILVGTAERTPQMLVRPAWSPVFNDISGPIVPLDLGFVGAEGFVIYNLTRWNEAGYQLLASYPSFSGGRGSWGVDDVGTLMMTEEQALTVWVYFPYGKYPAYSTMPQGYRFPGAVPYGPEDMNQLGTQARRLGLLFHCLPAFDGTSFTLYDNDMSAVSGLSRV